MNTREHVAAWALTLALLTCLGVLAMAADVRAQRDELNNLRLRVRVLEDAAEVQVCVRARVLRRHRAGLLMAEDAPAWMAWAPQVGGAVMALGGLITALRGILSDGPGVLGKLRDAICWCWSHGTPWGRAMMAHHEERMAEVAALRRQVAELQRAWDGEDTDVETTQTRDQLAARLLLQLQELLHGRD